MEMVLHYTAKALSVIKNDGSFWNDAHNALNFLVQLHDTPWKKYSYPSLIDIYTVINLTFYM